MRIDDLRHIQAQISIRHCKLENVFLPFLDVMMQYLPIHLGGEAEISKPIHYLWIYRVERLLYILKSLNGNRACAESSIAEGYIANECMTFCLRYLYKINTKFNWPEQIMMGV